MQLIATCAFGLEKLVKDELKALGMNPQITEDGRVAFEGDDFDLIRANLWLRCADRILVKMAEFESYTFDELFDEVSKIDWGKFIGKNDKFPVLAVSVKSALHSEPAIQSIVKKAIVKRLQNLYNQEILAESSNSTFTIHVKAHKDRFTIAIDSSGESLHKRGYRERANLSPIKETLAAAIVKLSDCAPGKPIVDLFCGSGTLLIEAYLMLAGIAPGAKRSFAFHTWPWIEQGAIKKAYLEARGGEQSIQKLPIYGFDIDPYALSIAKNNALNAEFESINLKRADFRDLDFSKFENCTFICNPPYGERMEDVNEVREMYKELGRKFKETKNCSLFLITSHEDFPKLFGKPADKNRKLFNGNIKCYLFSYYSK